MPNTIRASVVQTCTASSSLFDTLRKFENLTKLAKHRDDTQLVVFPEAFIGGYPKMSTFGCVVGDRSAEGREEFLRYHQSAIGIPSPTISHIEAVSKDIGVFVVMGVIEREGGTLYCTVIFVDPIEGLVGKHRKVMPTGTERLIWGMGDGTSLPVLERAFSSARTEVVTARISAAICWDNYMPLTHYYSLGTQIYCAPIVDHRPTWTNSMIHIAVEGRCFVLSACQFATEGDYPEGHAVADPNNRDPDEVTINGGSMIVSPLGTLLAGPSRKPEDILTAELDLDDIIRGKFDLDTVGHYARPDSTSSDLLAWLTRLSEVDQSSNLRQMSHEATSGTGLFADQVVWPIVEVVEAYCARRVPGVALFETKQTGGGLIETTFIPQRAKHGSQSVARGNI